MEGESHRDIESSDDASREAGGPGPEMSEVSQELQNVVLP